jgi:hypothetical protein
MSNVRGSAIAIFIIILAVLVTTGSRRRVSAQSSAVQRFVGTWRLVSVEVNGKPDPNRGAHPKGLIYYDTTGHMAVQIAPDRPRPSWPQSGVPTPEQAREAVTGYAAYFGTYSVDERGHTVTHRREGALNFNSVDFVRKYEFAPDGRLMLVPVDNPSNKLTWERIK